MASRSVTRPADEVPQVGARQPCPCGSGRRYKACHGKGRRTGDAGFVARPFECLPGECDWIALREIVSAATAAIRLAEPHRDRQVMVATLLPMAVPALVRVNGQIVLALQTATTTDDPTSDLARALLTALAAEPGTLIPPGRPDGGATRLQDLVDSTAAFPVAVHETFEFWLDGMDSVDADFRLSMEQANAAVTPAARLASVDAGYWCRIGDREQVRWVMPHDEEPLLDALARLHAAGADDLGPHTRLLGTFRALGRLVPVWDLAPGTVVEDVEEPAAALAGRHTDALTTTAPLTIEQRRARAGLTNRQVTVR